MTDAHQPPHQEGSHHGSTRLIRHAYGEGERYVPLVLRAQQLWDEFAAASGEAVFERTGVINLGLPAPLSAQRCQQRARVPAQYRRNGCAGGDDSLAGNSYS
jgi:glycine/D-amino acid oxidase-like deaminating enzyme